MSNAIDITQAPPAQENRRATKLARALFRLLADRPAADLQHVFRALAPRPGRESDERVGLALASLNACVEAHGRQPSRRDYDRWRSEQARPEEFVSATFIRDVFRGWRRALDAIGVAPDWDPAARRLLRNGRKFPHPALERALQLFGGEVPAGERTRKRYEAWAAEYLERSDAVDVPSSAQPFTTPAYGKPRSTAFAPGWAEALLRAGLEDERLKRRVPSCDGRGTAPDYTPERMLDALRECVATLGVSQLTTVAYERWARQTAGEPGSPAWRPIPRAMAIWNRFGGWGQALHAAGLISDAQLVAYRHRIEFDITTDRALTFLAAAMRDCGPDLNRMRYRRWRTRVMAHPEFRGARVPSDVLLYERCGKDWPTARDRARHLTPAPEVPPHLHTSARPDPEENA